MKILQYKLGGEFDYNVSYETKVDKRKLQTNDQPTGNLGSAAINVVTTALDFFRLNNLSALFKQITFSYPDGEPEGFVLELTIKSKENIYISHSIKTERLTLATDDVISDNKDFQLQVERKNNLVKKILKLREEIESYVKGARNQQELSFNEEAELFDGE